MAAWPRRLLGPTWTYLDLLGSMILPSGASLLLFLETPSRQIPALEGRPNSSQGLQARYGEPIKRCLHVRLFNWPAPHAPIHNFRELSFGLWPMAISLNGHPLLAQSGQEIVASSLYASGWIRNASLKLGIQPRAGKRLGKAQAWARDWNCWNLGWDEHRFLGFFLHGPLPLGLRCTHFRSSSRGFVGFRDVSRLVRALPLPFP